MNNYKSRIAKLEKQNNTPQFVEIWGTREDNTRYLIETWKQLVEADRAGHLAHCPQWQRFIADGRE